jgi:hypothetical protein
LKRLFVPFVSFCSTPCRRGFIRSIFPCRTGWSGSGGTGAEAQWLFLPEPDTRKTRLTRAARQARTPEKFKHDCWQLLSLSISPPFLKLGAWEKR